MIFGFDCSAACTELTTDLNTFIEQSDVVTLENENIPTELFNEINTYRVSKTFRNNFFTDLIHILARLICLRKDAWIKSFHKDFERKEKQLETLNA